MKANTSKIAAALLAMVACSGCTGLQAIIDTPIDYVAKVTPQQEKVLMEAWLADIEADMRRE